MLHTRSPLIVAGAPSLHLQQRDNQPSVSPSVFIGEIRHTGTLRAKLKMWSSLRLPAAVGAANGGELEARLARRAAIKHTALTRWQSHAALHKKRFRSNYPWTNICTSRCCSNTHSLILNARESPKLADGEKKRSCYTTERNLNQIKSVNGN